MGRALFKGRNAEGVVSRMGNPKETTGIATAIMVEAFWAPSRASALSRKPMNRLPQSPRKIVAGLKLKRRNPRIAPESDRVNKTSRGDWLNSATTKTTRVEK